MCLFLEHFLYLLSYPSVLVSAMSFGCPEYQHYHLLEFQKYYREDCQSELYYRKENGKYQLNLWRANEIVMEEAGILPENIHTTQWCTCCNPELLYSHRASKGKRGNLAAFLGLKRSE